MSEKRPETDGDILTRSKPLSDADVRRADARRRYYTSTRPGAKRYKVDLSSHMAECDANYVRLKRLLPELQQRTVEETHAILLQMSPNAEGLAAYAVFEILEQGPYTTLLKITLSTTADAEIRPTDPVTPDSESPSSESSLSESPWMALAAAPQMSVRVYHDAQSAEIVSYQNQTRFHGIYEYPNLRMRQPDEKIQLNRFLGEFLAVCLDRGASAEPVRLGSPTSK